MARIFSFSYQSHHVKDRSGRSLLNVVARWQPMFSSHLRSRSGTMPALRRNKAGKLSRGGCLHKRTQKAAQSLAGGCVTIGASVVRLQMRLTGKRNKKGVSVL